MMAASGASKRRRKAEAAKEEDRRKGARAVASVWLVRYREIGAPPADPVGRVEWANRMCSLLLWETLSDVKQNALAIQRRRLAAELIRTLGMTAVKALYESRLKKLEERVYGRRGVDEDKEADDGLTEYPGPTAS